MRGAAIAATVLSGLLIGVLTPQAHADDNNDPKKGWVQVFPVDCSKFPSQAECKLNPDMQLMKRCDHGNLLYRQDDTYGNVLPVTVSPNDPACK